MSYKHLMKIHSSLVQVTFMEKIACCTSLKLE